MFSDDDQEYAPSAFGFAPNQFLLREPSAGWRWEPGNGFTVSSDRPAELRNAGSHTAQVQLGDGQCFELTPGQVLVARGLHDYYVRSLPAHASPLGHVWWLDPHTACLQRCPACEAENYALAVSSGRCYACGYDAHDCPACPYPRPVQGP